jgi:tetratricopeptide (TPR) repeat protein
MFADQRRHPHWESFDPYLQFAARYQAAVDGMEHNDFVSQGATGKAEEVRRNYEAICQVILRFLNGHLKGDAEALKSLRDAGTPGLVQVAYKAATPAPPTRAQIARMYVSEGAENQSALAALVKGSDADLVVGAAALLFEGGHKREGVSLLTWAAPILPDLADLQRALGDALLSMGDRAGSRKAFEKALALLPSDGTLDAGQKAQTRKAVEEGLKALLK